MGADRSHSDVVIKQEVYLEILIGSIGALLPMAANITGLKDVACLILYIMSIGAVKLRIWVQPHLFLA